jgi:hypothetical protein
MHKDFVNDLFGGTGFWALRDCTHSMAPLGASSDSDLLGVSAPPTPILALENQA